MSNDDLPEPWHWGGGEASRPLSERGYYLHMAYRPVWKNQHKEQYFELRIDTAGMPPYEHVLEASLREQTDSDNNELERLGYESVQVIDPEREASQRWAESRIHELAIEYMHRIEAQLQYLDSSTVEAARQVQV